MTLPPDSISTTSVILRGQYITSDTIWNHYFNFGRTISYELSEYIRWQRNSTYTTKRIGDTVFVSCRVKNLVQKTLWHYRLVVCITDSGVPITSISGVDQVIETHHNYPTGGFLIPISFDRYGDCGFGIHTEATNCIDWILDERLIPPFPPLGAGDIRFVSPTIDLTRCYDQGMYTDLRPYYSPTQSDTFRMKFQPRFNEYPVVIKWGNTSNYYTGSVRMVYPLNGSIINTDMKSHQSDTIFNSDINSFYIIAEGPQNLLPELYYDINYFGRKTLLGTFNPEGVPTIAWFMWDTTKYLRYETPRQNIGSSISPVTFVSYLNEIIYNKKYYYRSVTQNSNGTFYGDEQTIEVRSLLDVNNKSSLPNTVSLLQNHPNPFNPSTVIRYQLSGTSAVTVKVFNTLGQEVATLVDDVQEVGYKSVQFKGENLPSGIYFYRLNAAPISSSSGQAFTDMKKMVLLK
jgi:hypothetical protein